MCLHVHYIKISNLVYKVNLPCTCIYVFPEELGNMGSAWSVAWKAKKPEEKIAYKQRALELTSARVDEKKTRAHLLKNIDSNVSQ